MPPNTASQRRRAEEAFFPGRSAAGLQRVFHFLPVRMEPFAFHKGLLEPLSHLHREAPEKWVQRMKL